MKRNIKADVYAIFTVHAVFRSVRTACFVTDCGLRFRYKTNPERAI
jgi:hypothetical protein